MDLIRVKVSFKDTRDPKIVYDDEFHFTLKELQDAQDIVMILGLVTRELIQDVLTEAGLSEEAGKI